MTWHEREAGITMRREGDFYAIQQLLQCQGQHAFHVDGTECFVVSPAST